MVKRRLENVGGMIFIPLERQGFFLDGKEIAVVMCLQFQVAGLVGCKKMMGQRRSDVGVFFWFITLA